MFTRMSFLRADPARADELIEHVRTVVQPALKGLPGCHGLGMWMDRSTGNSLVMTVWSDEAAMNASESAASHLRDDAAAMAGNAASVERYNVALVIPGEPHQPGYAMRLITMTADNSRYDDNIAWARDYVVPQLRKQPGFVSYIVGRNETGGIATMTTYRDRTAADNALEATQSVRDAAKERGISITGLRTYEVAIVGIDAPRTALPQQHGPIDLRDQEPAAKARKS